MPFLSELFPGHQLLRILFNSLRNLLKPVNGLFEELPKMLGINFLPIVRLNLNLLPGATNRLYFDPRIISIDR